VQAFQFIDDRIERLFLLAQFERFLGVIPNLWMFEFGVYLFESITFDIEVKDTPLAHARGEPDQKRSR
jgi:hypothetical protein